MEEIDRLQNTRMVKRDENVAEYHCDVRDLTDAIADEDIEYAVYYFPGTGGTTAKDANGGCEIIQNGLALNFENREDVLKKVSLYGIYYGIDYPKEDGHMVRAEVEWFVRNHLISRCLNKAGELLSVEDICKKISKVTFVGYCHGQKEINSVIKVFKQDLQNRGVKQEEVQKIVGNMFAINFQPEMPFTECPAVQVFSIEDLKQRNDGYIRDCFEDYMEKRGQQVNGVFVDLEKAGQAFGKPFRPSNRYSCDFDRINIWSSRLLNEHDDKQEHLFRWVDRDEKWYIKYLTDANVDCVSQMFFAGLAFAVHRGFETERTGKLYTVDSEDLCQFVVSIAEKGFTKEDLRDHSKFDDGDGK